MPYEYPDYAEFGGSFFYGFHDIFNIDGHINGSAQVSQKRFNIEAGLHACVAVLGWPDPRLDAAIPEQRDRRPPGAAAEPG